MGLWQGVSLRTAVVFIVALIVLIPTVLVLSGRLETGFCGKSLWDLMDVLGVPLGAALIVGVFGFAAQQAGQRAEIERELTIERAREAALRAYLDRISGLVLDRGLKESERESPGRALAQAWTLGALRGLDGPRKGILVQFLHDSKLIARGEAVVSLALADLTRSDLSGADLARADLSRGNLTLADLYDADLRDADLYRSVILDEQLAKARSAIGARLPDGTMMTEHGWKELKAEQWRLTTEGGKG